MTGLLVRVLGKAMTRARLESKNAGCFARETSKRDHNGHFAGRKRKYPNKVKLANKRDLKDIE
jgi:hypothetical protein